MTDQTPPKLLFVCEDPFGRSQASKLRATAVYDIVMLLAHITQMTGVFLDAPERSEARSIVWTHKPCTSRSSDDDWTIVILESPDVGLHTITIRHDEADTFDGYSATLKLIEQLKSRLIEHELAMQIFSD